MLQLMIRPYKQMIGLARYTVLLQQALNAADMPYDLISPGFPWPIRLAHQVLARFGFDTQTFFTTYPLSAPLRRGRLTHLTVQQMAFLLWLRPRLWPVIVTVHDIVPYLVRDDPNQSTFQHPIDRFFDHWAVMGLKRATALICDSDCTKQTIISTLDYPQEQIHVVYLGVAHEIFFPQPTPPSFYARYRIDPNLRYILYVGSENPRKNLSRLIQAFTRIRAEMPDIRLLKVGSAEYLPQAEVLKKEIEQLGLAEDVLFFEHVSDKDLALFYNAASLFAFPSLYEGFGLPPLEAMACGTPVVASFAASIPEVVGDAAVLVDPVNIDAITNAMRSILNDDELAADLRQRGLARAAEFSWERTARETIAVYEQVLWSSK